MKRVFIAVALFLCIISSYADNSVRESNEILRIRVENSTNGRVQVSLDQGKNYTTVGHVTRYAESTFTGFPASAYVPVSTVAATAVHGIRLKVSNAKSAAGLTPLTISLVPKEFDSIPKGYGGHIPYGSGIYTDIPSGDSIFRNFAPFVGNPVFLEKDNSLVTVPEDWDPSEGDVVVIIAKLPHPYLSQLEFENRKSGAVTATYDDGTRDRVATVTTPVKGVGRFDGTSYTGVGLINTNHGGVITVSTSPITTSKLLEGYGDERRGGFQVQPFEHAKTQYPMPQAMVIAPAEGKCALEGAAPVFFGYIGLSYDSKDPSNSTRVEVSYDGVNWSPMPQMIGKIDDAISSKKISRFRIVFPKYSPKFLSESLIKARSKSGKAVSGTVVLRPSTVPQAGSIVTYSVDGKASCATSQDPFDYEWDTRLFNNGEHQVEITVNDRSGAQIYTEKHDYSVSN